jgi:hypothetical protein
MKSDPMTNRFNEEYNFVKQKHAWVLRKDEYEAIVQLLEAELKSTGRDLAYLIKAKQEFAVREKINNKKGDIT